MGEHLPLHRHRFLLHHRAELLRHRLHHRLDRCRMRTDAKSSTD
jgi:hypothetical protein